MLALARVALHVALSQMLKINRGYCRCLHRTAGPMLHSLDRDFSGHLFPSVNRKHPRLVYFIVRHCFEAPTLPLERSLAPQCSMLSVCEAKLSPGILTEAATPDTDWVSRGTVARLGSAFTYAATIVWPSASPGQCPLCPGVAAENGVSVMAPMPLFLPTIQLWHVASDTRPLAVLSFLV